MAQTPVRKLVVSHPSLPSPVTIPLKWDTFPDPLQKELDALDTNDDGEISYTAARGGAATSGTTFEAQHSDDTALRLSRVLWVLGQSYPTNNRKVDNATLVDRARVLLAIQNDVYDNVVLPVLGSETDRNDPTRWLDAERLLEESADHTHLHSLSQLARARYESTKNIEFLRVAEKCLLAARRFAALTPAGRKNTLAIVDRDLRIVNPLLDQADRTAFQKDVKFPYLLTTIGSPITADLSTLKAEAGMVYFGVAVPKAFVTENEKDLNTAIARYFNETSPVTIRASAFRDQSGTQDFTLTAASVERDAPGPMDDRIDIQSSFHINQARLNRTVFEGKDMVYLRVGFRMPQAADAMGDRSIRRFDVTLKRGVDVRRIDGGFVLQNMAGKDSRDVFASDLHISERDYEEVKVLTDSLRGLANRYEKDSIQLDKVPILRSQIEEVERFYESVNEQVTAAVDQWNRAYRLGEIDRVFLDGDLADVVNMAATLELQGYRSTNVRRFREIVGRLEAPLFVVTGNHDHRGHPFPLSIHKRNFVNAEGLQDLFADHYDGHRFSGNLTLLGIKALLQDSSTGDGWIKDVLRELYADDPYSTPNDAFLNHHLREIGIYETYGVSLGNSFRVFAWPTETEHFNYGRYLLEEVQEPVGLNALKAIPQYVLTQHVNAKGPRPENFVAFLRELETAKKTGQRVILLTHYPPFFKGEGPDQTPDSADTLRGDVALAVRLASWYYRNKDGESVLALSVGGHVHHYSETDFILHFKDSTEENRFRTDLGAVFDQKDTSKIYDRIHGLRQKWDLDDRSEIRRVQEPGSDGFPGPIMRGCNQNSCSFTRSRGTAFVNLTSAGVPSSDQAGYMIVTSHPNGKFEIAPRFIRTTLQGGLIDVPGTDLESFRRRRWDEAKAWDATRPIADFEARTKPTAVTTVGPSKPNHRTRWDLFPIVYQYPRRKIALTFDSGWAWDMRTGRTGFSLGGQVLLPLSREPNLVFGGPNYLALGAEYNWLSKGLKVRGGLDLGIVTPYLTVDALTSKSPVLGGELFFHGIFPHAGVTVFGGSSFSGDWNIGMGLRLTFPVVTYRLPWSKTQSYTPSQ